MKVKIHKTITYHTTLDSSEMIMFQKGGQHKVKIEPNDLSSYDEVIITVQLDRNEQDRFDFITGEAKKHKENIKIEGEHEVRSI